MKQRSRESCDASLEIPRNPNSLKMASFKQHFCSLFLTESDQNVIAFLGIGKVRRYTTKALHFRVIRFPTSVTIVHATSMARQE